MHRRIECPSCSMTASSSDRRHFPTVSAEPADLRRCRNCGASVVVSGEMVALGPVIGVLSTR